MKVAISGKGGVGKSTLAAGLALLMSKQYRHVLAVDADPDANLALSLGVPADVEKTIVPISEQIALIEERTGAKVKQYGQMFKLNPHVADIAEKYAIHHQGVSLLVLGAIERGGSGCACPESVLVRALVSDLVLYKDEAFIMDMEAGIEHLGRATAKGVDTLLVVIEPGQRSIESAFRVIKMANEIGLTDIVFVANKITNTEDESFIKQSLDGYDVIGFLPYSEQLRQFDRFGRSVLDTDDPEIEKCFNTILDYLKERNKP
jgi:CO dehydrogenase maturation factor